MTRVHLEGKCLLCSLCLQIQCSGGDPQCGFDKRSKVEAGAEVQE